MTELFDSLNPYESLDYISAKTPEDLIIRVKEIRTPIKVINIISHNSRFIAFIMGDLRKPTRKKRSDTKGIK